MTAALMAAEVAEAAMAEGMAKVMAGWTEGIEEEDARAAVPKAVQPLCKGSGGPRPCRHLRRRRRCCHRRR